MQSDVLWSSVEQLCHLLLAQPYRFFGELYIQPNCVICALVYNYRFVCLTICLHLFCHLLSFPSSLPGRNVYIICFGLFSLHSFSFASRSHPERHCRVSIPLHLVPFLISLVLFYLPCSFFIPKREQPSLLPCVFFIYLVSFCPSPSKLVSFFIACVFFSQSSLKKDTTICFHSPHPCRAQLYKY